MKKYNVLVFPCGTEIANEVINSLKNHKLFKVFYASSDGITFCNFRNVEIDILPFVSDEDFENSINKVIKRSSIDFIIPAHDDVAFKLSEIENSLEAKIIGQSYYVNEIVRFKDVTYEHFKDVLPLAKLYTNEPVKSDFPLFTKPKRGEGSNNAIRLGELRDYKNFFSKHNIDDFVVMEYLTGKEFTIDCFSDNGEVLYFGARIRDKTSKGISVQSTLVSDIELNKEFSKYTKIISKNLNMNGVWFYQMKYDKNNELKLLEVAPRVSGTMMLNRARGINFIELSLYQKLGYAVEVIFNDIDMALARSLVPIYKHNIQYENLYVDFDDTLFLDERYINAELMQLIFQVKNEEKNVYLITKNKKNNLTKALHNFGISNVFDDVIHINPNDNKMKYMKKNSLLIDDSFQERKEAISHGLYAYANDTLSVLIK